MTDHFDQDAKRDQTYREGILYEGAMITAGDRNKTYNDPDKQFHVAAMLVDVLETARRTYCLEHIGGDEMEAWRQVCTKMARRFSGRATRDTYVDAATYIAIAGELWSMQPKQDRAEVPFKGVGYQEN